MADAEYSSYPQRLDIPPQRLVSDIGSSNSPQIKPNPSKFFSNFLSKSVLVAVVLVLLPLFPSQAPEFVNQTVLSRSWELLHLLFVGIAVSYGLFSRRNVETEKENSSKIDNTQNYMSRILQVSSVFDDEIESPSSLSSSGSDENKIQTWNSQYFRGNPMVLVAQTDSVLDEQSSSSSRISTSTVSNSNKPLLLPVRSLKSQVPIPDAGVKSMSESGGSSSGSLSRSGSGVKIHSSSSNSFRKMRSNSEIGGLDPLELEEKLKESTVLPSPIPWRSRSGRIEMKDVGGIATPPLYSLPPSMGESESNRVDSPFRRSSIQRSSRPNSASPSPRKLSPSPSLTPELRPKNLEDLGKKKSHYNKSSPPPPPPPPPPPVYRKSPLMMSNSTPIVDDVSDDEKEFSCTLGFKNELKDFSRKTREDVPSRRETGSSSFVLDSLKSEVKSKATTQFQGSSYVGRSVRTNRPSEPVVDEVRKTREVGGHLKEGSTSKRFKEVEAEFMEEAGRKAEEVFDQQSMINTERNRWENPQPSPKPTYSKYRNEEKNEIFEKVVVESDTDEDSDDSETNETQGSSYEDAEKEEANTKNNNINTDEGPNPNEVDKKADEFIAKFREQIRLQRIASIKKSSTGKNVNNRKNSMG